MKGYLVDRTRQTVWASFHLKSDYCLPAVFEAQGAHHMPDTYTALVASRPSPVLNTKQETLPLLKATHADACLCQKKSPISAPRLAHSLDHDGN